MSNACRDCNNRHAGCHSTCEEYIAYRAEKDRQNEREKAERMKDYAMDNYYSERRERARKRAKER